MNILIESSCDINSSDSHGKTPLYYSIENGFADVIELLIQNHCNINVADENDNFILNQKLSFTLLLGVGILILFSYWLIMGVI